MSSSSENDPQCQDVDRDGGRCQILDNHEGPHAASVGDAYLTWEAGRLSGWSIQMPPPWLFHLRWTPGFGPAVNAPPAPTEADEKLLHRHGRHRQHERQRRTVAARLHGLFEHDEPRAS